MKRKIFLIIILIIFSGCKPTSSLGRLQIISADLNEIHNLIPFHRDCRTLFVVNEEQVGHIAILADTEKDNYTISANDIRFFDVSLSKDDQQIVFCFIDRKNPNYSNLGVYDLRTGDLLRIDIGKGVYFTPFFSPTGDKIVFSFSSNGLTSRLYVFCLRTFQHEVLTTEDVFDRTAVFYGKNQYLFWRAHKYTSTIHQPAWRYWEFCRLEENGDTTVLTPTQFYNRPIFAVSPDKSFMAIIERTFESTGYLLELSNGATLDPLIIQIEREGAFVQKTAFRTVTISNCSNYLGLTIDGEREEDKPRTHIYIVSKGDMAAVRVATLPKRVKELSLATDLQSIFYISINELDKINRYTIKTSDTDTYRISDMDSWRKIDLTSVFIEATMNGETGRQVSLGP